MDDDRHPETYRDLLMRGRQRLGGAGIETAALDAAVLLAHAARTTRTTLYARLPEPVDAVLMGQYDDLIAARERGVPVAYLVGEKEFLGLTFAVTPATLVPRPETELLVEWSVRWYTAHTGAPIAVDVGTGSGAIAVSLAYRLPGVLVVASDVSADALRVARANAVRHGVAAQTSFVCGDLLMWLHGPVSLVVANLPYLTDQQSDDAGIAAEPRLALAGGDDDGFALYRRLIPQVARSLAGGGAFAFEVDPAQGRVAQHAARVAFPAAHVAAHEDLAGLVRFITVEK